jgi:hypothetical protein
MKMISATVMSAAAQTPTQTRPVRVPRTCTRRRAGTALQIGRPTAPLHGIGPGFSRLPSEDDQGVADPRSPCLKRHA